MASPQGSKERGGQHSVRGEDGWEVQAVETPRRRVKSHREAEERRREREVEEQRREREDEKRRQRLREAEEQRREREEELQMQREREAEEERREREEERREREEERREREEETQRRRLAEQQRVAEEFRRERAAEERRRERNAEEMRRERDAEETRKERFAEESRKERFAEETRRERERVSEEPRRVGSSGQYSTLDMLKEVYDSQRSSRSVYDSQRSSRSNGGSRTPRDTGIPKVDQLSLQSQPARRARTSSSPPQRGQVRDPTSSSDSDDEPWVWSPGKTLERSRENSSEPVTEYSRRDAGSRAASRSPRRGRGTQPHHDDVTASEDSEVGAGTGSLKRNRFQKLNDLERPMTHSEPEQDIFIEAELGVSVSGAGNRARASGSEAQGRRSPSPPSSLRLSSSPSALPHRSVQVRDDDNVTRHMEGPHDLAALMATGTTSGNRDSRPGHNGRDRDRDRDRERGSEPRARGSSSRSSNRDRRETSEGHRQVTFSHSLDLRVDEPERPLIHTPTTATWALPGGVLSPRTAAFAHPPPRPLSPASRPAIYSPTARTPAVFSPSRSSSDPAGRSPPPRPGGSYQSPPQSPSLPSNYYQAASPTQAPVSPPRTGFGSPLRHSVFSPSQAQWARQQLGLVQVHSS